MSMRATKAILFFLFPFVCIVHSFCSAPVNRRKQYEGPTLLLATGDSPALGGNTTGLRGLPRNNPFLNSFDDERATRNSWEENFQLLKDYKKVFKTTRIKVGDDRVLSAWVSLQRCNKQLLSQEKIDLLNSIGFEWEKGDERNERRWKEMFNKLENYKAKHGDCLVPKQYYADPALGIWVGTQRRLKKERQIQPEREKQLDQIGFVWQVRNYSKPDNPHFELLWETQYNKTLAFKETHGHCMIPRFYAEDTQLSDWVRTQRAVYKRGDMRPDREQKLNEIGFVWECVDDDKKCVLGDDEKSLHSLHWETMFGHLLDFKAAKGHVNVPQSYKKFGLGWWVARQRSLQSQNKTLTVIGFRWRLTVWNDRFEQLRSLFEEQGDCSLPPNLDRAFKRWIYGQRYFFKKGRLSSERIAMLESIGFPWGKAQKHLS